MSRKKLPAPTDPLARKLFAALNGVQLAEGQARLQRAGLNVPVRTLQHWRAGRGIHPLYRPLVRAALAKL